MFITYQSSFPNMTTNNIWSKYYTPHHIADLIVSNIQIKPNPKHVIDICVGRGNLLEAIHARWRDAKLLATDLDESVVAGFGNKFKDSIVKALDATNFEKLSAFLVDAGLGFACCDVVVANPPFGACHTPSKGMIRCVAGVPLLERLYTEAVKLKRIEAFMIIANILCLREGGVFAAVLPENLFTSEKWNNYRKVLFKEVFKVKYQSDPGKHFEGSDVRTRVIIANLNQIKSREKAIINVSTIKQYDDIKIIRGRFVKKDDAVETCTSPIPVFHSGHVKHLIEGIETQPYRTITNTVGIKKDAIIRKNDVVVVRVGKACGRAALVKDMYVGWQVSDCVLLVRTSKISQKELVYLLNKHIRTKSKGLTVRYVTHTDIMNIIRRFKLCNY